LITTTRAIPTGDARSWSGRSSNYTSSNLNYACVASLSDVLNQARAIGPPSGTADLARQSRFQMDDNGDLHEQILHIEAYIEELADIVERCRKIILISKVALAAGGILILATIIGAVGFDPTVLIGAIAAVIGGMVVFGSNTSTLKQTMTDMKAAEAHRTELIGSMDLRVVGDGEIES